MAKTKRRTKSTGQRFAVHQAVTDKIIAALERGVKPWVHPWKNAGQGGMFPLRHSGEAYQGMNVLLLWCAAQEHGYRSRYWMTFRQAKEYGGCVSKGEKGSLVIKYGTVERDADGNAVKADERSGDDAVRKIAYTRGYTVFNAEQIEGLPDQFDLDEASDEPGEASADAAPILQLEQYFGDVGAKIETTDCNPCYIPSLDMIRMPPISEFVSSHAYFSCLAHECCHWTKAPQRLDRKQSENRSEYAQEELIAEIGANLVFANLGLVPDIENSAAYVASWLTALRNDRRFIFEAAAAAQKAAAYIDERATAAPAEMLEGVA